MGRFDPPPAPQHPDRFTAPGLGGSASHVVPQTEDERIAALQEDTPDTGFFGMFSRSRFLAPLRPQYFGHGGSGPREPGPNELHDPADRYVYGPTDLDKPMSMSEGNTRLRTSGLGVDDIRLVMRGFIRYVRNWSSVPSPSTRPQDPIRWGDNPPVVARRATRYTLRPEFMQEAQNFSGLHTLQPKVSSASTATSRMRAPRTSRLTRRARSGSYGQTTEVLNA